MPGLRAGHPRLSAAVAKTGALIQSAPVMVRQKRRQARNIEASPRKSWLCSAMGARSRRFPPAMTRLTLEDAYRVTDAARRSALRAAKRPSAVRSASPIARSGPSTVSMLRIGAMSPIARVRPRRPKWRCRSEASPNRASSRRSFSVLRGRRRRHGRGGDRRLHRLGRARLRNRAVHFSALEIYPRRHWWRAMPCMARC